MGGPPRIPPTLGGIGSATRYWTGGIGLRSRMRPQYRPGRATGKQPPMVLLRGMEELVDLGDGQGWPKLLAFPNDAGLLYPCYQSWGFDTANEPNLGKPNFN